jgi:hypothetical protein
MPVLCPCVPRPWPAAGPPGSPRDLDSGHCRAIEDHVDRKRRVAPVCPPQTRFLPTSGECTAARILILVAAQLGLGTAAIPASAKSTGETGVTLRDTGTGCGTCHGAAGVVAVQVLGPPAVLPGRTVRYEVLVQGITNALAEVGFNAAISRVPSNQPTFAMVAGEPTRLADSNTQIVHTNATQPLKRPVDGAASYAFDLVVPAATPIESSFTLYAVGDAGKNATQVGWNHAANVTLTIAPPVPSSLIANQATATSSSIELSWNGTQGEHFRVLRKTGGYPTSPTDPTAVLVLEGPLESAVATGLAPLTRYYFAAYGKAPDASVYSSEAARASADTTDITPTTYTIGGLAGTGLVLRNNGGDNLAVTADGGFTFATALPGGATYAVSVFAQPTSPAQWCTVTHATGTIGAANVVDVQVACANVAIGLLPTQLDFGDVRLGATSEPRMVIVENTGAAPLRVTDLLITGPASAEFAVVLEDCSNATLAPGADCGVELVFAPTQGGDRQAVLSVASDRLPIPADVPLSGTSNGIFIDGFEDAP